MLVLYIKLICVNMSNVAYVWAVNLYSMEIVLSRIPKSENVC